MKKLLRTSVFLLLAGMAVTSCVMQRSVSESQSANNPDYRVSYLFEHDGCRVYRFYDSWSGSYVYFTTQGDVTAIPNDSTRRQNRNLPPTERQHVREKGFPAKGA